MSVQTAKHLINVSHLEFMAEMPPGSRLQLPNVSWIDYEYLLGEINDSSCVRISYDKGGLELMTLSPKHEIIKVLFTHILSVLTEELGMALISLGSTTFKLPTEARGTEPDDCFYIRRAELIEEKETIDLSLDPGPDLVLEVDLSHPSLDKFPIYASLDVTEIWRYDGESIHFYLLTNGAYDEIPSSDLFPFLTPKTLSEFLLPGKLRDINKLKKAFREWVNATK